jgi:rare lipoprotein A
LTHTHVIPARAEIQAVRSRGSGWIPALAGMTLALLLSACGTAPKPGKYYADDGPPERVPDGLAHIPDATPRDEPFHRFANRPYTVFGQTYVPVVNRQPTRERGLASWYGRKFHGQKTASGETYDMFAMTAAHKTLPIPSYARVTNVKSGQSVVVRVNDRGPFHANRIIDLSYAAAARIGIVQAGSALVDVERIVPGAGEPAVAAVAPPPPPTTAVVETPMVARENSNIWLQLGAFSSAESAASFRDRVARDLPWMLEPVAVSAHDGLHRVRLGPYRNAEEAAAIGEKVRRSLGVTPVMTQR